jgi:hypothetical protein
MVNIPVDRRYCCMVPGIEAGAMQLQTKEPRIASKPGEARKR